MKVKLLAIVLLLVVGGAAIVVTLGGLPRSAAAATSYLTSTAAIGDVSDDVAATGSVASSATWTLAFGSEPTDSSSSTASSSSDTSSSGQSDGTWVVKKVDVKVGDTVKKGQVLATATNPDLDASIAAAKNSWTAADLQLLQAQDAYDAASGTSQLRQARSGLLNAQNAVDSAHRSLVDLKAVAARSRLVAPAAGIVTAVNVTAGSEVPSGAAVTVATTDYDVSADVVESDIASMKIGQPATVRIAALDSTLQGTVSAIAPTAADSSSGSSGSVVSYAVTVAVANPPAELRAGMTADVTITTASASGVLAVPAAAIRGVADNYSVLVMTAAGTPQATPVQVGLMTSSLVEITSGLNAGDVVVTGTSSTQRSTTGAGFGGGGGFGGGTFGGGRGPQVIVDGGKQP